MPTIHNDETIQQMMEQEKEYNMIKVAKLAYQQINAVERNTTALGCSLAHIESKFPAEKAKEVRDAFDDAELKRHWPGFI